MIESHVVGESLSREGSDARGRAKLALAIQLAVLLVATSWLPSGVATASSNIRVNTDQGQTEQGFPDVAVVGENVYLTWIDGREENDDIYFARSTDAGATFTGPNVRLNDDAGVARQVFPAVAASPTGTVYVVWEDDRMGDGDIYLARSPDGGVTWAANVRMNGDTENARQEGAMVAIDAGGAAYVAWLDTRDNGTRIYLRVSSDGGLTWAPETWMNSADTDISDPTMTAGAADSVALGWGGRRDGDFDSDVSFAMSTDGGVGWTDPTVVISGDAGSVVQRSPSLTLDTLGAIYGVWEDGRNGNFYDIYFAKSNDSGLSWTIPPIRISEDLGPGADYHQFPTVAIDAANNVYVAWSGWSASLVRPTVYLAKSGDGGATWSRPVKMNADAFSREYAPSMAVDRLGRTFVAWEDNRDGSADIYFARTDRLAVERGGWVGWWWVLLLVVSLAVAMAVLLIRRRRRKAAMVLH